MLRDKCRVGMVLTRYCTIDFCTTEKQRHDAVKPKDPFILLYKVFQHNRSYECALYTRETQAMLRRLHECSQAEALSRRELALHPQHPREPLVTKPIAQPSPRAQAVRRASMRTLLSKASVLLSRSRWLRRSPAQHARVRGGVDPSTCTMGYSIVLMHVRQNHEPISALDHMRSHFQRELLCLLTRLSISAH